CRARHGDAAVAELHGRPARYLGDGEHRPLAGSDGRLAAEQHPHERTLAGGDAVAEKHGVLELQGLRAGLTQARNRRRAFEVGHHADALTGHRRGRQQERGRGREQQCCDQSLRESHIPSSLRSAAPFRHAGARGEGKGSKQSARQFRISEKLRSKGSCRFRPPVERTPVATLESGCPLRVRLAGFARFRILAFAREWDYARFRSRTLERRSPTWRSERYRPTVTWTSSTCRKTRSPRACHR